ncbi:hypothetical protein [Chryseobacterium populi]|uniref:Uncharacterized protein n=1 Tax=Chryseobacterium populi TaxID=1144316 RepID=J2JTF6_9FLAO|nr:hypothetical protein [Chryseobacterium populi]EJL71115.1 hypothetical protein PMI13_02506 [Chryseobacterium populi]
MKAQRQTPAYFFKVLPFIFLAFLGGMVTMGTMIYVMSPVTDVNFDLKNPFLAIMLIVMIGGIFGSNLMYNSLKNKIEIQDSTESKVTKIQRAIIMRFAFVEGPALLGIVFYLKEVNLVFLMLSAMMVLYFLTLRPSKEKILNDMNLTSDERREFE